MVSFTSRFMTGAANRTTVQCQGRLYRRLQRASGDERPRLWNLDGKAGRYNHAKYCDSRRLSRLRGILGCVVGKFFRLAEGESEIIPSVEQLSSIVERVSRALWHFCQPLSCAGTCESHR